MRIALCSTIVPHVRGGARNIVDWLKPNLEEYGHKVEVVYLPQTENPENLFDQMMAFRWINLDSADRVICFRPQSHLIRHDNKVIWFIHHIRTLYDLWDSTYNSLDNSPTNLSFRNAVREVDTKALLEAKKIFTNSQTTADRLRHFNGVQSEVLYPPILDPSIYCFGGLNNEIVYVSRLNQHKRQELAIEAMSFVKTDVKLRLIGMADSSSFADSLRKKIGRLGLQHKVFFENDWVSESNKAKYVSNCLALAYFPIDEDSYGYPTLEASAASKPVITTRDSGGTTEFVIHEVTGFVVEPNPKALAEAMDRLYLDRNLAIRMGRASHERVGQLQISWSKTIEKLTS